VAFFNQTEQLEQTATVLIIDDEVEITDLLGSFLEDEGYSVHKAHDGASGLRLATSLNPDLVILDMNLPKMSGPEVFNQLRLSNGRLKYPTLILTIRTELGDLFHELKADGFIDKPFKVNDVIDVVRTIVKEKRGKCATPAQQESGEKATKTVKISERQGRVLIVENDQQVISEIVPLFEQKGYLVDVLSQGTEVFGQVLNERPDLILMKLNLPDVQGHKISYQLKESLTTRTIPILLFTNPDDKKLNDIMLKAVNDKTYIKSGLKYILESDDPAALLKRTQEILDKTNGHS
jgi:DNA-binding response OmpR family regulator